MPATLPAAPPDALILAGLSLRQLRLVHALGEHGQMQRAADHLRISQPAASKLLAQVEGIVKERLFDRQPRGLLPTVYGETLLRRTHTLLREIGLAAEELRALRAGHGGRVAIGSVMQPAVELVAPAIAALQHAMPRLSITLEIDTSEVLASRLLAGQLDLVLARVPATADAALFEYEELAREHACLVVRDAHPLAGAGTWPLASTADHPWVLQHRGSLLRLALEALLRRHGAPMPERVTETSSFLATTVILRNSDAVAPMVLPCAALLLEMGGFRRIELPEPLLVEPYGLIRVRGRSLAPAVAGLCAQLRAGAGLVTA